MIVQLRDLKSPSAIAWCQSHNTLLTMPRLKVTFACLVRPGSRHVCVLSPPSAYSCTSVSICSPEQSLKPPGGRSSKVTVKRNAGTGSRRRPVSDILRPLLVHLDAASRDADANDDELGGERRLEPDDARHAPLARVRLRVGRLVAPHGERVVRGPSVQHAAAMQTLEKPAHRAIDVAPETRVVR